MFFSKLKIYKIYLELISVFLSLKYKKRTRRKFIKIRIAKYINNNLAKSTWGVSYSVFDGEELLEASIKSIRDEVDYINVVYQLKSWTKTQEPADKNLLPILLKLKENGLIDELIEYKPNFSLPEGINENIKRNIGLNAAKKKKIQYFMTMDVDEFYIKEEIKNAKKIIVKNEITNSFCNIVQYGTSPLKRLLSPSGNYVQFFSKVRKFSKLKRPKNIITLVDPTRAFCYFPFISKYYFLPNISMHHMSYIRKDLNKKYRNSSFLSAHSWSVKEIKKNLDGNSVICKDIFNLLPICEKF